MVVVIMKLYLDWKESPGKVMMASNKDNMLFAYLISRYSAITPYGYVNVMCE